MIRVIEIAGKNIPGDVYGIAHNCGKRLLDSELSTSALMYGKTQIVAKKQGDNVNVLVLLPGGFIAHPRTKLHPGGLTSDGSDIKAEYLFPLVDDDGGSVTLDTDPAGETSRGGENYGNIAEQLSSGATDPVSWRGPSGKFLANNSGTPIQGFLRERETLSETAPPFYTPYDKIVYQGGSALTSPPPGYVLCAAVISDVLWVVVQPLPTSGDQVLLYLKNGTWVEVARRGAYAEVPCIFQGDKIILNNVAGGSGEWTLEGAWTGYAANEGTLSRGISGWHVTKAINGIILWPGVSITKNSKDDTGGIDSWVHIDSDVPAKTINNNPLHWVSKPDTLPQSGSVQFDASGGTGPLIWATSQGSIQGGYIDGTGLCGMVTITVTDQCGVALTAKAKAYNGVWVASVTTPPIDAATYPSGTTLVDNLRVVNTFSSDPQCCGCWPNGCYGGNVCPPWNTWIWANANIYNIFKFNHTQYNINVCGTDPPGTTRGQDVYGYKTYTVEEWVCA